MIDRIHEIKRIKEEKNCGLVTAKRCVQHATLTKMIQNSSCYEDLIPVLQELVDLTLPQETQL